MYVFKQLFKITISSYAVEINRMRPIVFNVYSY